eukprot:TRINITY_DN21988_c0_g1_i1.p1 TRINITY_DN21988_c0_g1~~TRINITY_DN21988_c0_g1_i1.p1  ORF type:complete len:169 (+),score=65.83 TRINITY_DN21988_c0_g1_i1:60-566(+)
MSVMKVALIALLFAVVPCAADLQEELYQEADAEFRVGNETDLPGNKTDMPMTDTPTNETSIPDTPTPDSPATGSTAPATAAPEEDDDKDKTVPIIIACVGGAVLLGLAAYIVMRCRTKRTPEEENLLEDPSINVSHTQPAIRPEELRRSVYDPESETNQVKDTEILAE